MITEIDKFKHIFENCDCYDIVYGKENDDCS